VWPSHEDIGTSGGGAAERDGSRFNLLFSRM
jgi:hypothetical protein